MSLIISEEKYNKLPNNLKKYFEKFKNIHPTVKNLKLMSYLITLGSRKGDTVLDPFVGSGTTPIACILTGRNHISYEISKEYVDIANARINYWKMNLQDREKYDKEQELKEMGKHKEQNKLDNWGENGNA